MQDSRARDALHQGVIGTGNLSSRELCEHDPDEKDNVQ